MQTDLAIVGAGPAGLAAAIEASALGLNVTLVDEQSRIGGQIYRNIEQQSLSKTAILGADYYAGIELAKAFNASNCQYINQASVWQLGSQGELYYSRKNQVQSQAHSLKAKHILLASGAQERPFPIPGWTLPGVMTAGAAQILLKTSGVAAEGAVFAGSGPLLYLIVYQYIQAGIKVKALLDTTPKANYVNAIKHLDGALKGWQHIYKGLSLIKAIKAAGVSHIKGVKALEALATPNADTSANLAGPASLDKVQYKVGNRTVEIQTEHLFLHQGVVPNVNLAMASGCLHDWHQDQACWQPVLDEWGQSSQANISIIGDGAGIAGAQSAAYKGRLTAIHLAHTLGKISLEQRDNLSKRWRKHLNKEQAFRPFLDALYLPPAHLRRPQQDDTLVCRCEEVSYGEIKSAIKQGCMGPNQLKSFTRCGMGPCQGRQCGLTVTEIMAYETQEQASDVGYYRVRAPIKPLNLGELASLDTSALEQEKT